MGYGFVLGIPFLSNWSRHLPKTVKDKFLYLWTGKFSGDDLLSDLDSNILTTTGKDFSTTYIPETSTATFKIPNTSDFITADEDYIWYLSGTRRDVTITDLITYDFERTLVYYDNNSPYNIRAIGILKSGEVLSSTEIDIVHSYFRLSIFWDDIFNLYGYLKGNRGAERSIYNPSVAPNGDCSNLVLSTTSDSTLALSWTNGSTDEDGISIERSIDGGSTYSELTTVGAGITSYSDTSCSPSYQYYYRVRAYKGILYSNYSNVDDEYTATPLSMVYIGAGTGRLAMRVLTSNVTMTIDGDGYFYDDAGGTTNPNQSRTITTGGLRNFYVKLGSGTSKILVFAKGNLASIGDSSQTGWNSVASQPRLVIDLAKMPSSMINFRLDGTNSVTGDIGCLSSNLVYFRGAYNISDYQLRKTWNALTYFNFYANVTYGLSATEMDNLLIDFAASTWAAGPNTIILNGANANRTAASDAAKTTLTTTKNVTTWTVNGG